MLEGVTEFKYSDSFQAIILLCPHMKNKKKIVQVYIQGKNTLCIGHEIAGLYSYV
jgi:hypothetical protein